METSIRFLIGNPNIWAPLLAIILGFLTTKNHRVAENILHWFLLLVVGLIGIEGFIAHAFFAEQTAKLIGWGNNPFQYEVAIANLSFGILGIIAFIKKNYDFSLATVIGFSVWFFGDGIGHIYQYAVLGNAAPYNAGSTLYTDLLLPLMGLILIF